MLAIACDASLPARRHYPSWTNPHRTRASCPSSATLPWRTSLGSWPSS